VVDQFAEGGFRVSFESHDLDLISFLLGASGASGALPSMRPKSRA
jgi:hypothetical protein